MDQEPGGTPRRDPHGARHDLFGGPGTASGRDASLRRWMLLGLGGCVVLPALLLGGLVGCLYAFGGEAGDIVGSLEGEPPAVGMNEPLIMGSVSWTVTGAKSEPSVRERDGVRERLDLVVLDVSFTNSSEEAVDMREASLLLVDGAGNAFEPDGRTTAMYAGDNAAVIFWYEASPGATRQGKAVFGVPPEASGLRLEASDPSSFRPRSGYVDLGL